MPPGDGPEATAVEMRTRVSRRSRTLDKISRQEGPGYESRGRAAGGGDSRDNHAKGAGSLLFAADGPCGMKVGGDL